MLLGKTVAAGSISQGVKKAATAVNRKAKQKYDQRKGGVTTTITPTTTTSAPGQGSPSRTQAVKDKLAMAKNNRYNSSNPWQNVPFANQADKPEPVKENTTFEFSVVPKGGTAEGPIKGFCPSCMTVKQARALLNDVNVDTACFETLAAQYKKVLQPPPGESCVHPTRLSDMKLRARLRNQGKPSDGTHDQMVARYITYMPEQPDDSVKPPKLPRCPLGMAALPNPDAACRLSADCSSVSCCVLLKTDFITDVTSQADIFFNKCAETITVIVDGINSTYLVSEDPDDFDPFQVPSANIMNTYVSTHWAIDTVTNIVNVDVTLWTCHPVGGYCTEEKPLLLQQQFLLLADTAEREKEGCAFKNGSASSFQTIVDNMILDDFDSVLRDNDINPMCMQKLMTELRVSMAKLFSAALLGGDEGEGNEFASSSVDICLPGTVTFPPVSITFFEFEKKFMVGPGKWNFASVSVSWYHLLRRRSQGL